MRIRICSLTKKEDFKSVLSGKKVSNKYLTIFFKKLSAKNNGNLNISFIVKKKIGNAVKRNKIKRRLKNIMNGALKNININLNYSYLLIANKRLLDDGYNKIKISLLSDFEKIK